MLTNWFCGTCALTQENCFVKRPHSLNWTVLWSIRTHSKQTVCGTCLLTLSTYGTCSLNQHKGLTQQNGCEADSLTLRDCGTYSLNITVSCPERSHLHYIRVCWTFSFTLHNCLWNILTHATELWNVLTYSTERFRRAYAPTQRNGFHATVQSVSVLISRKSFTLKSQARKAITFIEAMHAVRWDHQRRNTTGSSEQVTIFYLCKYLKSYNNSKTFPKC